MTVPNSSGTATPRLKAPDGTADCHLHIYDPRFRMAWPKLRAVDQAAVTEYRKLQERLGTHRAVVVQPAVYGTDNRVTLDAVATLGAANARGIAVLHPDVDDDTLDTLHAGGIRGLRFSLHDPATAVTAPDMIAPLAARVAERGWHVQLHLRGEQIVDLERTIEALPCDVVFDHMARLPQPAGIRHYAFEIVARRLEAGNGWVKLSGPYLDSRVGAPRYADATRVAREWVKIAPERLVWGSDWPHPTERERKPDDAVLLDLVQEWARDEPTRRRILVDNPARLYGF
jgi:predicted TIM-barrel fold metal-dependent hydrolase